MRLSEKCQKIQGSVTLQIDAKAKQMKAEGKDVVSFGAGEPDFQTPQYIIDAAIKALTEGKTKYTAAAGVPELRKAVCGLTKRNLGIDCEFDQVVISTGAKQALFNALQAIVNEGDEVIIFAPYWVSYPELVKMAGGVPVFVKTIEEKGFAIDFDALNKRYSIDTTDLDSEEILKQIARSQNFYLSNKEENIEKTSLFILQEYRSGYYGRITLDRCEKEEENEQL